MQVTKTRLKCITKYLCVLISENIWKTDLDFMVPYGNRLQILHVLTGGIVNASITTTQAPYHHPAAQIREYLEGKHLNCRNL